MSSLWNHNTAYYRYLLSQVPEGTERALDIGCGGGSFAFQLAQHCKRVEAVDRVPKLIEGAQEKARAGKVPVTFSVADFTTADLEPGAYGFVSCIATVHHMDLQPTVARLTSLLAPGGVLAILDLCRVENLTDHLVTAAAVPYDYAFGTWWKVWGRKRATGPAEDREIIPGTPLRDPQYNYQELRDRYRTMLPSARIRRHLLYRISVVHAMKGGVKWHV